MNALSRLITRVTKRQFAMATTVEEVSTILDRTIGFATANMIDDNQIEDIAATIPVVDPVTEPEYDTTEEEPSEPEQDDYITE